MTARTSASTSRSPSVDRRAAEELLEAAVAEVKRLGLAQTLHSDQR
jgi:hypothetical protein